MKILYIGPLNEGGTCGMRMAALLDLGHEVLPVDTHPRDAHPSLLMRAIDRLGRQLGWPIDWDSLNQSVVRATFETRPDLVWIDKGLLIYPQTLFTISKTLPKAKIIGYSPDDMLNKSNQSSYFRRGLRFYDLYFTTKTYNVSELMQLGARHTSFVRNGFDPATHRPVAINANDRRMFGGKVGFIGSQEADRAGKILFLANHGIPVRIWGWGKPASGELLHPNLQIEEVSLMSLSYAKGIQSFDINLGFLRKVNRDRQTTRSVEIPACEAFMLAERTDEHLELFEEGKEAEFFGSAEELLDKIKFYLKNESLRQKIARQGRVRCIKSKYDNHSIMSSMLDEAMAEI